MKLFGTKKLLVSKLKYNTFNDNIYGVLYTIKISLYSISNYRK